MKILIFFLLFFSSLFAGEINWLHANKFKNLKSEKIVLVEIMSKSCHYCKNMDKNVFSDKEVQKFVNKNFTPIKFDLYEDDVPNLFNTRMVPTFFFYDTKTKKVIKKVIGSWNKEDFLDFLDTALKAKR